jgi:hypothetical protein
MALFKCKQTGNTVEFDLDHDITAMRSHPDYEEVIAAVPQEEEKPVKKTVVKSKAE